MKYSLILPVKNEAQSLPTLIDQIHHAFLKQRIEIIAVNDASTDKSLSVLKNLSRRVPMRLVSFTRPAGKWAALRAGIAKATGETIITIDSDLQDDPKEVYKLLHTLNRGYDVVSGYRKHRQDRWYKVAISHLGNTFISFLTKRTFHDLNAPMKIYRRRALMAIPHEGSLLRFSLLFAHNFGFKTIEIPIMHRPRIYGSSKFGFVKYIRILYDLLLIQLLFSGSGRLTRIPDESIDTKV